MATKAKKKKVKRKVKEIFETNYTINTIVSRVVVQLRSGEVQEHDFTSSDEFDFSKVICYFNDKIKKYYFRNTKSASELVSVCGSSVVCIEPRYGNLSFSKVTYPLDLVGKVTTTVVSRTSITKTFTEEQMRELISIEMV